MNLKNCNIVSSRWWGMKATEKWQLAHAPVTRMHDQGLGGQNMSLEGATAPVPSCSVKHFHFWATGGIMDNNRFVWKF